MALVEITFPYLVAVIATQNIYDNYLTVTNYPSCLFQNNNVRRYKLYFIKKYHIHNASLTFMAQTVKKGKTTVINLSHL